MICNGKLSRVMYYLGYVPGYQSWLFGHTRVRTRVPTYPSIYGLVGIVWGNIPGYQSWLFWSYRGTRIGTRVPRKVLGYPQNIYQFFALCRTLRFSNKTRPARVSLPSSTSSTFSRRSMYGDAGDCLLILCPTKKERVSKHRTCSSICGGTGGPGIPFPNDCPGWPLPPDRPPRPPRGERPPK